MADFYQTIKRKQVYDDVFNAQINFCWNFSFCTKSQLKNRLMIILRQRCIFKAIMQMIFQQINDKVWNSNKVLKFIKIKFENFQSHLRISLTKAKKPVGKFVCHSPES